MSQSGYLANQDLIKNLATFGYHPVKRTPELWKHRTRRTTFTLVTNGFGVQFFSKEDADHLIISIAANYPVKADWTGSKYIGINLDWNYTEIEVKLSMTGHVKKSTKRILTQSTIKTIRCTYKIPQAGIWTEGTV